MSYTQNALFIGLFVGKSKRFRKKIFTGRPGNATIPKSPEALCASGPERRALSLPEPEQSRRAHACGLLQKVRIRRSLAAGQHYPHIVQAVLIHRNNGKRLAAAVATDHSGFRGAGLGHMFAAARALVKEKDLHAVRRHRLQGTIFFSHGRPPRRPDSARS